MRTALLAAGILVAGCQAVGPFVDPHDSARQLAAGQGLTEQRIETDEFPLVSFVRGFDSGTRVLTIYIEGDGRAFVSRRRVSADPTPRDPVALKLAAADPAASVAYLARPCQFLNPLPGPCEPRYWTTGRYAPAVIASLDAAVAELKQRSGAERLTLVGFSGGAVVATLLAQRREDIDWLVTLSGNMDHRAWTGHHGDTPLVDSLDPLADMGKLERVRQLHLAGGADDIVPPALVAAFVRALPPATPVEFLIVDGIGHDDWPAYWRENLCGLAFRQARPGGCSGAVRL